MRLPWAGGWPSGLRGLVSRPAEAWQWRGLWLEEDGVGRVSLTRTVRRSEVEGARPFACISSILSEGDLVQLRCSQFICSIDIYYYYPRF